ncbi:MAG: hypothetical protein MZW92_03775 [Comamonadaceae bacterium]|nr:hypothetical protein [Comamonadaceae bacterium]
MAHLQELFFTFVASAEAARSCGKRFFLESSVDLQIVAGVLDFFGFFSQLQTIFEEAVPVKTKDY